MSAILLGNSLALACMIALPLLIFAYLKHTNRKTKVISSLFIFKRSNQSPFLENALNRHSDFFLELLALLCACFAAALPFLERESTRIALVFDNSMSMHTVSERNGTTVSRMKEAIKEAEKVINESPTATRFSLFSSAPEFTAVGNAHITAEEAKKTLSLVQAQYTEDNIESGLGELQKQGHFATIHVFSDRRIDTSSSTSTRTIAMHSMGTPQANASITGITLKKSSKTHTLSVSLGLFAATPLETNLTISQLQFNADSSVPQETRITSKKVRLKPGSENLTTFKVPSSNKNLIYKASLDETLSNYANALRVDDVAWISSKAQSTGQMLIVSPNPDSSSFGFERIVGKM